MTIPEFAETLGLIGVVVVLVAYLLLQLDKLKAETFSYSFANLIGSAFVLYSLYYYWNWPSVLVETAWVIISLYGIYKWALTRRRLKKVGD